MNGYLKLAVKNLLRHRTRSALTMLGIAASVGVLFSVLSFNRGFNEGLAQELQHGEAFELDQETRDQLEALGYLGQP